jgi:uncharacterized protein YdaU (DUF1376 family)
MSNLSSKTDDAPAFQFYVKDWFVDTRVLTLEERGVWADTLAVMWTSPERGVLKMPNGCDPDAEWLRGTYGANASKVKACLDGIVRKGVASKRADGAIYNRRMVRIAQQNQARSDAGRKAAGVRWGCETDANHAAPTPTPTPTPSPTPTATPKEKDRRESPPSEAGRTLAGFLQSELTRTLPGIPSSKQTGAELERRLLKWAQEFDAFGRIDKVDVSDYRAIITWALADEFWRTNIRSPGSLRTMKHGASAKVWVDFRKPKGGYSGRFSSSKS